MNPRPIAFLGLGIMGGGMARRLLGAGFALAVYNRNRARTGALAGAGARVAETPRDAAAGAGIVISMVADDAASRAMWLGDDGDRAGRASPGDCRGPRGAGHGGGGGADAGSGWDAVIPRGVASPMGDPHRADSRVGFL